MTVRNRCDGLTVPVQKLKLVQVSQQKISSYHYTSYLSEPWSHSLFWTGFVDVFTVFPFPSSQQAGGGAGVAHALPNDHSQRHHCPGRRGVSHTKENY